MVVWDFNGDGATDVAVSLPGYFYYDPFAEHYEFAPDTTVVILIGTGQGTFEPPRNVSVGTVPSSLAIGDFNQDGVPDLAVANSQCNSVSVLLGDGDGTFKEAINFGTGRRAFSVVVGDFNRDGLPDLAVADNYSDDVSVLINRTQIAR